MRMMIHGKKDVINTVAERLCAEAKEHEECPIWFFVTRSNLVFWFEDLTEEPPENIEYCSDNPENIFHNQVVLEVFTGMIEDLLPELSIQVTYHGDQRREREGNVVHISPADQFTLSSPLGSSEFSRPRKKRNY